MHCNVAMPNEHIHDLFPKSFWTHDFKQHRSAILFSLERSQCAATLPYVQMAAEHEAASAELLACRRAIAELNQRLAQQRQRERALLVRVHETELTDRSTAVKPRTAHEHRIPCSTPQCRGLVSKDAPACACCHRHTCHRCHKPVDASTTVVHACADDDVATVQELQRNAKQCPECRVYISKVDGCDQMFCVSCHTAFSWNTGERLTGPIHNPHYFEVRERLGEHAVAHPPAQPCDEVFPDIRQLRRAIHGAAHTFLAPAIEQTHRHALHLREVVCNQLRQQSGEYAFHTNLRARVDWMRQKTTDEQFRKHLHRTDKKTRYSAELLALFQMYAGVVGGLFHNMTVQRTVEAYDDIVKLKEYTLTHLQSVKARYGSHCTLYDKMLQ